MPNAAETESPLKYETLEDGTIEITDCDGTVTKVEIPAEIDGKKVTRIGDHTFAYCSGLTSVTIPDSVTSIGGRAFANCLGLTEITILNPNCKIPDDDYTIASNAVIKGYIGSTAEEYEKKYERKFESLDETPATQVIAGNANCDGKVSIADSTAILQHLGNQDKYGLSAEGLKNADVDENDGVSTNNALVIQMVDSKLLTVEQLPLKK